MILLVLRSTQVEHVSPSAADEAREQARLPEVWVWSNLDASELLRFGTALRIRAMEARG